MRRRHRPADTAAAPAALRTPPLVEDWVSPAEIAAHTFAASCPVRTPTPCAGQCAFRLERLAATRHRAGQRAWLLHSGTPRGVMSLPTGRPSWRDPR